MPAYQEALLKEFLRSVEYYICEQSIPHIEACLNLLNYEEVWTAPCNRCNSIGHLILHLEGNVRQYVFSGIGNAVDTRDRASEFNSRQCFPVDHMLVRLEELKARLKDAFTKISFEELLQKRKVQIYDLTVMKMLMHVMEHFTYHTGQIVYYTKIITGKDLKFYDDTVLNNLK